MSPEVFSATDRPYGKTYGQWTVEWWRWALGTPVSVNPVVDTTGKYADVNQPSKDVWFLAGKFGSESRVFPQRECTLPADRSILFPVINCEANPLEYPQLRTKEDLIDHVSNDEDTIIKKDCFINGEKMPVERVQSDPKVFSLMIHKENYFGVKGGGNTVAAADGYWVFFKHLPAGEYTLDLAGECERGRLNSGASYRLTVV
jgi:hypothetical protein